MTKPSALVFFAVWIVAAFLSWNHAAKHAIWSPMDWPQRYNNASEQAYFTSALIPNAGQHSTHSVSTTTLPSGDLIAFWFGGSREGGKDVQIFQSYFKQDKQRWSKPKGILNVGQLGDDLGRYIGKIGNPLVFVRKQKHAEQQRMWLLFVTVSYGGWAGSSLNLMFSDDMGANWSTPKRLITSPFLNVSTLVRNSMYELEDGSMIVPVYHEFAAQFPELLRLSVEGEVIEKVRMYGNNGGIQPSLVQGEGREMYAFMRSGSHTKSWRVLRLKSEDEGQSWQDFTVTKLPNPNSAQIVAKVDENVWIWIGNFNPDHRQDLTLAISHDLQGDWQVVTQLEQGKEGESFSYPAITQGLDGIWHLMYTYNRKNIKHVQFNQAWLDEMIEKQGKQP